MSERDESQVTEEEARVARLRLEAMRDALARRPEAPSPRDWTNARRAAGVTFKGGTLLLYLAVILGGLYVLSLATKILRGL